MDNAEDEGLLYLYDKRKRLIAIQPSFIKFIYPTTNEGQCLIYFHGDFPPMIFAHSLYDLTNALDTFYNAN